MGMRKGELTKAEIIRKSAVLFNKQGYAGAALSDIMAATGLEKGGIYRHFASKDELALAAFEYAVELVNERYRQALYGKRNAIERLQAIVDTFSELEEGHPISGGCPIMNTAIDSDDAHPALRARAEQALQAWRATLVQIVQSGIRRGEVRAGVDPAQVADVVIANLEGSLMMSRLLDDPAPVTHAARYLAEYFSSKLAA
jgi:TetR/AcrR family transcriptional repressor of nem operon